MSYKYGLTLAGAYGLMTSPEGIMLYSPQEAEEYYTLVSICHDFVESYMDKHTNERLGYYDTLELASPEYSQKCLEWSLEYQRRKKAYRERFPQVVSNQ